MFLMRVFAYYSCVSSKRTLVRVTPARQNQPSSNLIRTCTCQKNHKLLLPLNYEKKPSKQRKIPVF